jgi:hypothetical protein
MRTARFTALAVGIVLITGSSLAAQTARPRIEIQSRMGDFYWVVATAADGSRRGAWVAAQIIDSINVNTFTALPAEAPSSPQLASGSPLGAPMDFDGIARALQTMRDKVSAAASALEGLPDGAVLRNRIAQIDQAAGLIRNLAVDQSAGGPPSPQTVTSPTVRERVVQPPGQLPTVTPDLGRRSRPQTRQGFWFNAGLGVGSLGCDGCVGRENGLSGGLSLGGTIGEKLLLGVGTSGWAKTIGDEVLSVGTLDARLRFYPARNGFFLTGGLGAGSISIAGESELGVGVILGVGYDIRVGRNVSLTPFYNGFAMRSSLSDANVGQLGIGITIH